MSITANLLRQINFPGVENYCLYRFDIPSVPAMTIQTDILFSLHNPGKFENIRVSCDSPNYNFSIYLEPGTVDPTIEKIYEVINISRFDFDDNVDVWWAKPLGPGNMDVFGEIKNNASIATGVITFEFVLRCF